MIVAQDSWRIYVWGWSETSPERSGLRTDAVWVAVVEALAVGLSEICVERKYRVVVTLEEPRHEACAANLPGERGALTMATLVL